MAKAAYIGAAGVGRKLKKMYVGVDIPREEYGTQLEYIESSGTQYIDTGFAPNQDTRIDIRTMPLSVADGGFIPYGAATGYDSNAFECYTTGGQYEFNYDGQYDFVGTAATGHLLSITHDKNNVTVTNETNGSEWTLTLTYKEFTAPQKLVLCAINRGSITCGSQKLYSCKIYDNGTLIRDYVPCKLADGSIGMFDKVEYKFYANAGTGVFTAGAEVGAIAREARNNIARKVKKGYVGVEYVYTELEYIESTGTQYIDTGFAHNQDPRVVMDVRLTDTSYTTMLFDGRNAAYVASQNVFVANGKLGSDYGNSSGNRVLIDASELDISQRMLIDFNRNVLTINDYTCTWEAEIFQAECSMYLLACNTNGSITQTPASAKLYGCQIYDNGMLIRDYVPCKDTTGAIGLYDKVAGKFYVNAGSGVFTAGAETGVRHTKSVAKLFYSAGASVLYTGTHTLTQITSGGIKYNLLTMTGSGTLTIVDDSVQAWICGGGGGGGKGSGGASSYTNGGGGGGGGYTAAGVLDPAQYTVTIGAGGNAAANGAPTTILDADGVSVLSASNGLAGTTRNGGNGGSGGGASGRTHYYYSSATLGTAGTGAGVSTYPFGIETLYAHCAGGGGGGAAYAYDRESTVYGGKGGTNGGTGSAASAKESKSASGGSGGVKGGGTGGTAKLISVISASASAGSDASFWGSGGGGGACGYEDEVAVGAGGTGYQGVGYVLWPAS